MMDRENSLTNIIYDILIAETPDNAPGTQSELIEQLKLKKINVNQSSISRALKKLGAIKARDSLGRTIYKIPEQQQLQNSQNITKQIYDLVTNISYNETTIVIKTRPGSASLVSYHLDELCNDFILGTIAGDDTIFVSPYSVDEIRECVAKVKATLMSL